MSQKSNLFSRRALLVSGSLFTLPLQAFGGAEACYEAFSKLGQVDLAKVINAGTAPSKLSQNTKLAAANLASIVYDYYGPLTLKYQTENIKWEKTQQQLMRDAGQVKNTNDAFFLFTEFVSKFNDIHISAVVPSNLVYRLPIQLNAAEGRLFVHEPADSFPTTSRRPVQGDEVIRINGVSPRKFLETFGPWRAKSNPDTALAHFAMSFPQWQEARGIPLSKFSELSKNPKFAHINDQGVKLSLRSKEGDEYEVDLPFVKQGIGLVGRGLKGNPHPEQIVGSYRPKLVNSDPLAPFADLAPKTAAIYDNVDKLISTKLSQMPLEGTPRAGMLQLGERESFFALPANMRPIELPPQAAQLKRLLSDEVFKAGVFEHNGARVGFLRIASYSPKNLLGTVLAFRYLLSRLQAESDYLVIDQTNNPGGYVILSDLIIKGFTGKFDFRHHLQFSVKPTQKFLRQYKLIKDEIETNGDRLLTDAEALGVANLVAADIKKIEDAAARGDSLSEPITMLATTVYFERSIDVALQKSLNGRTQSTLDRLLGRNADPSIAQILQRALGTDVSRTTVYDKDVYMMINEMDISGGDATPAGLQDYGRAKLIGKRTAGGGASVGTYEVNNAYQMKVHLSESLMRRNNAKYPLVEQFGVTPDIDVPLLAKDIQDGYKSYFARIMENIAKDRSNSK